MNPLSIFRRQQGGPPDHVGLDDVRELLDVQPSGSLVVGLGKHRYPVTVNMHDLSHLLIASGAGGGGSTLARSFAAQTARQGRRVTIVDPKRTQHRWAEGLADVEHWTDPDREISPGITALAEFAHDQFYEDFDHDPRLLVLDGSMPPSVYLDRQAQQALSDLLMIGRYQGVHVVLATNAVTAAALGSVEEQFGVRILARQGKTTWRRLAGQNAPARLRRRGRVHVVTPFITPSSYVWPIETQSLYLTDHEARALSVPLVQDLTY